MATDDTRKRVYAKLSAAADAAGLVELHRPGLPRVKLITPGQAGDSLMVMPLTSQLRIQPSKARPAQAGRGRR